MGGYFHFGGIQKFTEDNCEKTIGNLADHLVSVSSKIFEIL